MTYLTTLCIRRGVRCTSWKFISEKSNSVWYHSQGNSVALNINTSNVSHNTAVFRTAQIFSFHNNSNKLLTIQKQRKYNGRNRKEKKGKQKNEQYIVIQKNLACDNSWDCRHICLIVLMYTYRNMFINTDFFMHTTRL